MAGSVYVFLDEPDSRKYDFVTHSTRGPFFKSSRITNLVPPLYPSVSEVASPLLKLYRPPALLVLYKRGSV